MMGSRLSRSYQQQQQQQRIVFIRKIGPNSTYTAVVVVVVVAATAIRSFTLFRPRRLSCLGSRLFCVAQ